MTELVRIALALIQLQESPPGWVDGGITFYGGARFEGRPLYCGGEYKPENSPWLAVDVNEYRSGRVRCGDTFLIEMPDGSLEIAVALDAGHLSDYTVWDSGLPFVGDLPTYWRDGCPTGTGRIVNLSAAARGIEMVRNALDTAHYLTYGFFGQLWGTE